MTFAFIHTADWQLGRAFSAMPEEARVMLGDARHRAVDTIAEKARSAGVATALVAGDIFDSETLPDAMLRRGLARLAAAADIKWHLIPGNHDPARQGGVWAAVRKPGLPENVVVHEQPVPEEIAAGVWLLPAPLGGKSASVDPTMWMDDAPTPEGALRIGLAHGSVQSFGSGGVSEVPIDAARVKSAGLDYLALGDWHGMTKIGPRCWYSGTPEPDRFRDNDAGNVLLVRLDAPGAAPDVTPIPTGRHSWLQVERDVASAEDYSAWERELRRENADLRHVLVKLTLHGSISLSERAEIEARIETLRADALFVSDHLSGLRALPSAEEMRAFEGDGEVGQAARWLRVKMESGAPEAERALALLHRYAGEANAS